MKSKLLGLLKSKTFWAFIILIVISLVLYILTKQSSFTPSITPKIESNYKITKINPKELNWVHGPEIYGDKIIYDANGLLAIYDIKTKKTKLENYYVTFYNIWGNYIVSSQKEESWIGNKKVDIKPSISLQDIKTGKVTQIADVFNFPIVTDNYVYWTESESNKVVRYDINTQNKEYLDLYATDSISDINLNKILNTLFSGNELLIYDTGTKYNKIIVNNGHKIINPRISDMYAIWQEDNTQNSKIWFYNIGSDSFGSLNISEGSSVEDMDIYNDKIIYSAKPDFNSDPCLYLYDITKSSSDKIFCGGGIFTTKIYENNVVVERYVDGTPEILLIELK